MNQAVHTMTQLEKVQYPANAHTTRGWRSVLATLTAAVACGLVLLATPGYAQTVPATEGQASVTRGRQP